MKLTPYTIYIIMQFEKLWIHGMIYIGQHENGLHEFICQAPETRGLYIYRCELILPPMNIGRRDLLLVRKNEEESYAPKLASRNNDANIIMLKRTGLWTYR